MSSHYLGETDLRLLRHGKGEYRYPNTVFRFDGTWSNGHKCGHGKFEVEGGTTFEGAFVDGEIEGRGAKTWLDGRRYEGNFKRGEACGEGCFTCPSGESYKGIWVENRRHGQGELVLPRGQGTYTGEFHRHRYQGDGRLLLSTGFRYSGKFYNGLPHGLGTATYPGGSGFEGPFVEGRRSGHGGKYICGVTGICFEGQWDAGKVVLPPSRWAIELDNEKESVWVDGSGANHAKNKLPGGAKGDKGSKGAKGKTKGAKQPAKEDEGGDADEPVIARYGSDGAVVGLWCRSVRDAEPVQAPQMLPELPEDGGESTRWVKKPSLVTVYEECGRTLVVTLHQVEESFSPGTVGAAVPFFVRRSNATDACERLDRFPKVGLFALFQEHTRCYPKGCTEKLLIVSGTESGTSAEETKSEPAFKTKAANTGKGKGGEQLPSDGGVEDALNARWQSIRSEVDSNRCLVIGAGKNYALKAAGLLHSEENAEQFETLTSLDRGNNKDADGEPPEQGEAKPNVSRDGVDAGVHQHINGTGTKRVLVDQRSPLTVCLDFRLDLDLSALARDDDARGEEISAGCDDEQIEKEIRILTCGEVVEISAVLRPTPEDRTTTDPDLVDGNNVTENSGQKNARGSGSSIASKLLVESKENARDSGLSDTSMSSRGPWRLYAILVRSGPCVVRIPCSNLEDSATETKGTPEGEIVCDLAEWHALAISLRTEDLPTIYIDGDVLPLRQGVHSTVAAVPDRSASASDGVSVGGKGGEWASLAVKNLAVYDETLESPHLCAMTRVFCTLNEEHEAAKNADALEEERWLEEARKAVEEEREPEERPEWLVGADPTMALTRRTISGEAKISNIVLPKAVLEGGEWMLRVEDLSHEACWHAEGEVAILSATDEERKMFPPLPPAFIQLGAAC